jgi:uncharacterized protein YybS (DUF2232 family)
MRKSAAQQAQGLIFGALMAALVIIFAFTQVLAFLIPIPLVITYLRYGGRVAVLTGLVATIFSLLFASPDVALLQVLPMGVLPGLALGMGFHRKWRPLYTGALTVLVFCFGYVLIYLLTKFVFFGGQDPIVQMVQMMKGSINQSIDLAQRLSAQLVAAGGSQEQIQGYIKNLTAVRENLEGFIRYLMPILLASSGIMLAWLNMKLCAKILPRFGLQISGPTPFGDLRLPVWSIWGCFALLLGLRVAALPFGGQPWWIEVIRNGLYALSLIYSTVGLAVAYGWLIRRGVPKPFAILVSLFGFMIFGWIYLILAAWDAIFDFRGMGHGTWRRPASKS